MKTATQNREWVDVNAEIIDETASAICLDFEGDRGTNRKCWIPKSQYRVEERGCFRIQQIKRWFIQSNRLWSIIR